ncbi:MAG: RNA-guided pseudouridylation complex pseudouridine synthase subunit Cbf5 [Candidatus Brocadiia bacterium]
MTRHVIQRTESNPEWGCPPGERDLREHIRRGAVLLDKPSGPTSRGCAERVCRLLGAEKGGHGGTLDPKVTGVLPILLQRVTPLCDLFLGSDKVYEGSLRLHDDVEPARLQEALEDFRGTIVQVPPVRSSVKREAREREVHEFEVTGREGRRVDFRVRCEGGTYIRKLAHDLGRRLGCGAHMTGLRRTASGSIGIDECVTLEELERAVRSADKGDEGPLREAILPAEDLLEGVVPRVWVDDGAVHSLCTGYPLAVPGVAALEDFGPDERVAVVTGRGELIGLGRAEMGTGQVLGAEHGVAVRMERVLMGRDVYPKWFTNSG